MSDFLDSHFAIICVTIPPPKGSPVPNSPTIGRRTARSEIYDIAKLNGYDVEVTEGIEHQSARYRSYSRTPVRHVTRFVLTYSDEAKAKVGDHYIDKIFVVAFTETDAFDGAWPLHYIREGSEFDLQPWAHRRQNKITKTDLLARLENFNPDAVVARKAEDAASSLRYAEASLSLAQEEHTAALVKVAESHRSAIDQIRQALTEQGIAHTTAQVDGIFANLLESQAFRFITDTHDISTRAAAKVAVAVSNLEKKKS